ncbi:YciI family protein [Sphingosinithalassobacter portus]|uniref:YciI family protein n=1 Tax=Stakelama portus TaxID=2676234 RepID=UPI000D6DCA6F|nr:YciI family protein [Sphingosinithalassobacter portus]
MRDFILLMHDDVTTAPPPEMWSSYFTRLRSLGVFQGGSAIGSGRAFRRDGALAAVSDLLAGYIRVRADNPTQAEELLAGNPVFECGGTVEIRELPRD